MTERKIHAKGPMWYLRCDVCEAFAWFDFRAEPDDWDHVCETADDGRPITFQVVIDYGFTTAPTFDVNPRGVLTDRLLMELAHVVRDVQVCGGDIAESIGRGHDRRRNYELETMFAEAEDIAARPHECDGCRNRFATERGLTQHRRSCRAIRRKTA